MLNVNYNERSWAIDAISHINVYLNNKSKLIKSAGGENTIKNHRKSLFPDVLLYGDAANGNILQGWELKMPDTAINNREFIDNAILKANLLKLNSFVLWNVQTAVLYIREDENTFSLFHSWDSILINNRREVQENEDLWKGLLETIIEDLNTFFESGEISTNTVINAISFNSIVDVVLENTGNTAEVLRITSRQSLELDAKINLWWRAAGNEYHKNADKYETLSTIILTDWVIKIVFANVLTRYFEEAKTIYNIHFETTIEEAIEIIAGISEQCNFWNIFNSNLVQTDLSETAWNQIIQLNTFLSDFNFESIDINIIQDLLQSSISISKRRVAGQFSTPVKLAEFLSRLTILDKTKKVIDPCSGTGTIINEAYKLMKEYQIEEDLIENNIWASDKYSFPVQLATLTLTKPENIGRILKIFKSDVIDLEKGKILTFKNPNNGEDVQIEMPTFKYVISNLPFIQQEDIDILNPNIGEINNWISENSKTKQQLNGRSDIYSYIPFYLWKLVEPNGKIGLILSNAFLGTKYGKEFLDLFQWFYEINEIVISGSGRWFQNADVVGAILTGKRKEVSSNPDNNGNIKFAVLKSNINEIEDIKSVVENLIVGESSEYIEIQEYQVERIKELFKHGFNWSALFGGFNWLNEINDKLIFGHTLFNFIRGERRGWNPMFYPPIGHGIENDYIKPVLKNLRGSEGLICSSNKDAFCCSESIEELEIRNQQGTLNWIRSFENLNNNKGEPLVETLSRVGYHWYEMRDDSLADFVANINFFESIFIAKLNTPSFVDQRLIGLSLKPHNRQQNKALLLALMNTTLSMFFIESLGFGRGLGALDLNKTKFENSYQLLNPDLLSENQTNNILNAFTPILERDRFPLLKEIEQEDRINFENIVMACFNIVQYYEPIKKSLKHLYNIRLAAIQ